VILLAVLGSKHHSEEGVLIGHGERFENVLGIQPPPIITQEKLDFAIDAVDEPLKEVTR